MGSVIAQLTLKLIKYLVLALFLFPISPTYGQPPGLAITQLQKLPQGVIQLPSGKKLDTYVASTPSQLTKGLSGVKSSQFASHQALFFNYQSVAIRRFWMPDTYFDLDILFLDKNLKIVELVLGLKHHPGRKGEIPTTGKITSRYALELRADSTIGKKLVVGDQLKWILPPSGGKELKTRSLE